MTGAPGLYPWFQNKFRCVAPWFSSLKTLKHITLLAVAIWLTLTAAAGPTITNQPVSIVVSAGQPASLSVTAGPAPLTYQWIKNGFVLTGQTNAALSFASFQLTNSGTYQVVLSNSTGLTISLPAALSLTNAPLRAWGADDQDQLGFTSTEYVQPEFEENDVEITNVPTLTASNVVAVAAGGEHSLFIKADGTLWAVGGNIYGELGAGSQVFYTNNPPTLSFTNTPVFVTNNVVAVAAGNTSSVLVRAEGTLWAMGDNEYGELGVGSKVAYLSSTNVPVLVTNNVVAVAASRTDSVFVKADGTLWGMGATGNGELGHVAGFLHGSSYTTNVPVLIASNVVTAALGDDYTLFIKADGTLWGTGDNNFGNLGIGNVTAGFYYTNNPVEVTNNVVAVAAGNDHSLFVKADGTLWAMGANGSGELGLATPSETSVPLLVESNVVAIAAGGSAFINLKTAVEGSLIFIPPLI